MKRPFDIVMKLYKLICLFFLSSKVVICDMFLNNPRRKEKERKAEGPLRLFIKCFYVNLGKSHHTTLCSGKHGSKFQDFSAQNATQPYSSKGRVLYCTVPNIHILQFKVLYFLIISLISELIWNSKFIENRIEN